MRRRPKRRYGSGGGGAPVNPTQFYTHWWWVTPSAVNTGSPANGDPITVLRPQTGGSPNVVSGSGTVEYTDSSFFPAPTPAARTLGSGKLTGAAAFAAIALPYTVSFLVAPTGGAGSTYGFQINGSNYFAWVCTPGAKYPECSDGMGVSVVPNVASGAGTAQWINYVFHADKSIDLFVNATLTDSAPAGQHSPNTLSSIYAAFGYDGAFATRGDYGDLGIGPELSAAQIARLYTWYQSEYGMP